MNTNTSPPNNQDNLLVVNELKKVSQRLGDIQTSIEKSKDFNLQTKLLFGNLIGISVLLIAGLALNFYLYKQQLKQLQKLDSLTNPAQYEYQIVSPSDDVFDEEMNKHGQLGWKATDCRRATSGSGYFTTASYECIMIRKK